MTVAVLVRPGQEVAAFGRYLGEILRAEGLVNHTLIDVGAGLPEDFAAYDAVVVTRMRLAKTQIETLVEYAAGGGRLLLVRPTYLFAVKLGLRPASSMVSPAYVRPLDGNPIGTGVPHEPIETHVPADCYALPTEAKVVANLQLDSLTPSSFPGIFHLPYGSGQVVVFAYDLAKAVSLIRQGDPGRVGGRGLGAGEPYRLQDLLTGYADPTCWHLPQADIHAMLLVNAVNLLARTPQPRWWYYPSPSTRSVLVLDSDDDWSAPEHFDALISAVEQHGGRITIYLMMGPTRRTIATPEKVAAWRERGHSFGIHHNAYDPAFEGEDPEELIEDVIRKDIAEFQQLYGFVPTANRNHCLGWKGYVDVPRLYAELGTDMDLNATNAGPSWLRYLTGSARPMRFVDSDGTLVDCFQQSTQGYDDLAVQALLTADPAGQAALTVRLMEEKVERYFGPMSMLSHPVSFFTYSRAYMNACWSAARELGMPIWSAFDWAAFTRARDAARISSPRWEGTLFSCEVTGRSPQGGLTLTLPVEAGSVASAQVDSESVEVTGLDVFGCPSTLVPVELPVDEDASREVVVQLA
ncbi:polysaccharide deacetylase family protein [Kribbella swartbergensis]